MRNRTRRHSLKMRACPPIQGIAIANPRYKRPEVLESKPLRRRVTVMGRGPRESRKAKAPGMITQSLNTSSPYSLEALLLGMDFGHRGLLRLGRQPSIDVWLVNESAADWPKVR